MSNKSTNNSLDDDYDFEIGDELSDMKLIVENKTLYVHKAILGMYLHKAYIFGM